MLNTGSKRKFSSILSIKITFQGVLNTGLKRKAGEWRKENANATNVESQTFQNDPILTSRPYCYILLSFSSENSESDIGSEVEHV